MAFPTLSRRAIDIDVSYEDNSLKHPIEAGYEFRRPRFTRSRRLFKVQYDLLPTADRDALVSHFGIVGTHTSFTWTDLDSTSYSVFYDSPLNFTRSLIGWYKVADIVLREV